MSGPLCQSKRGICRLTLDGDDKEGRGELIWLTEPLANLACDSFCLVTQGNKLSHIANCITQLQISVTVPEVKSLVAGRIPLLTDL